MGAMTDTYMNGRTRFARAFATFRSQPTAGLAVPASWLHVVCIDHKTGTGARPLGEASP